MDELREKLVAQDAGFDNRVIELFKVLVVYEHRFLLKKSRLRLTLASVSEIMMEFIAAFEHSPQSFRVNLPRQLADDMANNPERLQAWTKASLGQDLFNLLDHCVNIWRWSPQPEALSPIKGFAAKARDDKDIQLTSSLFTRMLDGLPRGTNLPSWAKQDLRVLFGVCKTSRERHVAGSVIRDSLWLRNAG